MFRRDCPEMPCDTVLAGEEWKAVYLVPQRKPPPQQPPSLDTMVAGLGSFLNRKADGFPGPKTLWISLQRVPDFVLALGNRSDPLLLSVHLAHNSLIVCFRRAKSEGGLNGYRARGSAQYRGALWVMVWRFGVYYF